MTQTIAVPLAELADVTPMQLTEMSAIELLEFIRRFGPTPNAPNIAQDHRRFLDRHELERLARLVQQIRKR